MNQSIEKIRRNASLLKKCFFVGVTFIGILIILSVVNLFKLINADVELFTIGEDIFYQHYEINNRMVSINTEDLDITFFTEKSDVKSAVIIWGVITTINLLLLIAPCHAIFMLLETIINDNPFAGGISKYLTNLGYGTVSYQLFTTMSTSLAQLLFIIFIDEYHRGAHILIKPEILFTFFLFTTLASIFKYGEELQTEVDGTV